MDKLLLFYRMYFRRYKNGDRLVNSKERQKAY